MIHAQYRLTFNEWCEAQNLWCKREASRMPCTKLLAWIYYALFVCSGIAMGLAPHWPGAAVFALLTTHNAVVHWRKKRLGNFLYNEATDRDKEVLLQINDDGYESVRPGFNECKMSWNCFTGWKEGNHTFILGRGMQYCSVPKRSLSPEQIAELRLLLSTKIGPKDSVRTVKD